MLNRTVRSCKLLTKHNIIYILQITLLIPNININKYHSPVEDPSSNTPLLFIIIICTVDTSVDAIEILSI